MLAIARKESLHIVRDFRSLYLGLIIPLILMALFGWAFTLDVKNISVVIWDQSKSPASRDFISQIEGSKYFRIIGYTDNYRIIEEYLRVGKSLSGLIIPSDFDSKVANSQQSEVQVLLDSADSTTGQIALGYFDMLATRYTVKNLTKWSKSGAITPAIAPLTVENRVIYNPTLNSQKFFIPGVIALILTVISAILTSLTIAREWERGTMEQLISTPIRAPELILGKLIPYWLIGLLNLAMTVVMSVFVFDVPVKGSYLLLLLFALVFLFVVSSQGMMFSIIFKNQVISSQVTLASTFLPTINLSGFVFTIASMPLWLQIITYIVPAKYFIIGMRGIFLKGIGINILYPQLLFLTLFGLVFFVNCIKRFKKRLM